ncbi:Ceramide very long chain fatty acid hydroxylase SCS7 [Ceratocystis platani]|uniref:Ceramide very long chain fatty acid hydroxylase n=1 Tax=Ceratocystis fimbriata f. sp. platani TaxID=88771 RepID=A0A0F8DHE3_CERFI|nr:Ceramide very long chain fatty acid hydroxylase SCS7 [Ceratocystis platani]
MPATRPTFTRAEIESHNSPKSCFMTINNKVYDVTDFVDDHPGGAELVLDYAGKDVAAILQDSDSHTHSEAAYEILDECFVGYVADKDISDKTDGPQDTDMIYENGRWVHSRTGMATEDDLSKDTDISDDYKKHKFLDLSKPLLMQVWFGGFSKRFYLEQVHRPRHYKGGASAPLFGNFLEPLSLTPWWLPDNRVALTLHFLLHGVHHYLPMDKYRLVMPPALFVILATPFYRLSVAIFTYSWHSAVAVFCGGVFGYICYDLTHYFLHHQNLPLWYKALKKYHLEHHFLDYENGFGVTTRFWDRVFGTELVEAGKKK